MLDLLVDKSNCGLNNSGGAVCSFLKTVKISQTRYMCDELLILFFFRSLLSIIKVFLMKNY